MGHIPAYSVLITLAASIAISIEHRSGVPPSVCFVGYIPKITHQGALQMQPANVLSLLREGRYTCLRTHRCRQFIPFSSFASLLGLIHIVDWLARRLSHAQRLRRINNLRVYIGRYLKHHLFAIIDDCHRDYGNRATV